MFTKAIIVSFSRSHSISSEKVNGKNYLSWSTTIEMWFLVKVIMITLIKMEALCPLKKV